MVSRTTFSSSLHCFKKVHLTKMVSLSLHIHLFVLKWTFERHAPQLSSVPLIAALIGSCCAVFIKLNAVLVCSVSFLLFRIGDFCRVWKPDHITVGGKGTRSSGTCFPAWTWRRLIVCCCLYNLICLYAVCLSVRCIHPSCWWGDVCWLDNRYIVQLVPFVSTG